MKLLLDGKVAVVTGGLGGIGFATASTLLAHGAKVVISDIDDELGIQRVASLGEGAVYCHADVLDEASVEGLVRTAVDTFGKLDIFYNNAGIVGDQSPITEIGPSGYDAVQALDTRSVLFGHKYAARQFKKQGTGGSIITTASTAGIQAGWAGVSYTAAKHAVVGLVRQAAYELGEFGIRSNAIAPGVVMTNIQARAFDVPLEHAGEFNNFIVEQIGSRQAMGRFGIAQDIANAALFLASDLSTYINGAVLPVDGGATAMTQGSFTADILAVRDRFLADKQGARS